MTNAKDTRSAEVNSAARDLVQRAISTADKDGNGIVEGGERAQFVKSLIEYAPCPSELMAMSTSQATHSAAMDQAMRDLGPNWTKGRSNIVLEILDIAEVYATTLRGNLSKAATCSTTENAKSETISMGK